MKNRLLFLVAAVVLPIAHALGQGLFVYDQQSSTDETPFPGSGPVIQQFSSYGQSFIPSLPSIDFFKLKLSDNDPSNGLGATIYLNLRSGSIAGPILGTTTPAILADGFSGVVSFFFAGTVTLAPGNGYYCEPIVQSGDLWNIDAGEYGYPNGSVFADGLPATGSDIWFREGVIVPEPASVSLLSVAASFLILVLQRRASFRK